MRRDLVRFALGMGSGIAAVATVLSGPVAPGSDETDAARFHITAVDPARPVVAMSSAPIPASIQQPPPRPAKGTLPPYRAVTPFAASFRS